jgi:hypothetical protein
MTVGVDDELRIREYPGDDTATPRAYGFKILDADDLLVTRVNADGSETVLVRGTHYTVSGAGNPTGGDVTPLAPIATGTSWRIEGDMALDQPTDYTAGDDFPSESHERGLDRSMIAHQEVRRDLNDTLGRSWVVPRGEAGGVLPPAAERAGKYRAWDGAGNETLASGTGGGDAALRGDMANPTIGALLLAWKRGGVGAVLRTVLAKLFDLPPSSADYGADPTGVLDSSIALQNLFADMATTGRANALSGTYKVTKPLVIPPGILEGGNVVLDFLSANPADFPGDANGTCVTVLGGAMVKLPNLSSDLAIGDRIFSFVAPHGLAVGDSFNLPGTVDYAGNGWRAYYRKGEMFRVAYVVGDPATSTSVAVEGACRDTYPAADVEVWKRSGDSFTNGCASLTIFAPDTIGQVIDFVGLDLSNIDRLRAEGGKWSAISITNCFGVFGENLKARQNAAGTGNYGIVISNSQDARLRGNAYGYFNGITVGGGLTTGGLVGMNRDIHFEGIGASHPTGGLAGANFHGNVENSSYRGVFINGLVMAGHNNEAHGEFIGKSAQPPITFAEMHGHEFKVTGTARTTGTDIAGIVGAIHQTGFGTNSVAPGTPSTARYGGRTVLDLRLYIEQATRMLLWRPTDLVRGDVVLDVRFDIMKGHGTTRMMIHSKNGTGNDFPLVEINRLNVMDTGGPAITWSVNAGTKFNNFRQDATVTVSGSGAASYTQAVTFPIPYPRAPRCWPKINGPTIAGTSPLTEAIKNVTATGGTVEVSTTDKVNQTVNSTVAVMAMSQ